VQYQLYHKDHHPDREFATSSPGRTVDGATLVDGLWLALRVVT
jgi:hypothetical protein